MGADNELNMRECADKKLKHDLFQFGVQMQINFVDNSEPGNIYAFSLAENVRAIS